MALSKGADPPRLTLKVKNCVGDVMAENHLSLADAVAALRAAGEDTRLRLLNLLAHGELNVKDLTVILGQSQPRISRHLKLLDEAGLVHRHREGASRRSNPARFPELAARNRADAFELAAIIAGGE